jgi:hypothetical protein
MRPGPAKRLLDLPSRGAKRMHEMSTPFSPGDGPSLWEAGLAEVMREDFEAKTLEVPAFVGIELSLIKI